MSILPPQFALHTPAEVQALLAMRLRTLRLRQGWKQETLAERSGVSLPTVRRFERSGQTTLANLARICQALGVLDQLATLFQAPAATSLRTLQQQAEPVPQRGRR